MNSHKPKAWAERAGVTVGFVVFKARVVLHTSLRKIAPSLTQVDLGNLAHTTSQVFPESVVASRRAFSRTARCSRCHKESKWPRSGHSHQPVKGWPGKGAEIVDLACRQSTIPVLTLNAH